MTQEDKELLLKDLCSRLPYGVICHYEAAIPLVGEVLNYGSLQEIKQSGKYFTVNGADCLYEDIKPYLRPMSSMTEEEIHDTIGFPRKISIGTLKGWMDYTISNPDFVDWLNAHHFDYRGLIDKGLALEATESMYKEV